MLKYFMLIYNYNIILLKFSLLFKKSLIKIYYKNIKKKYKIKINFILSNFKS